jgi:hypothetical protein
MEVYMKRQQEARNSDFGEGRLDASGIRMRGILFEFGRPGGPNEGEYRLRVGRKGHEKTREEKRGWNVQLRWIVQRH